VNYSRTATSTQCYDQYGNPIDTSIDVRSDRLCLQFIALYPLFAQFVLTYNNYVHVSGLAVRVSDS